MDEDAYYRLGRFRAGLVRRIIPAPTVGSGPADRKAVVAWIDAALGPTTKLAEQARAIDGAPLCVGGVG